MGFSRDFDFFGVRGLVRALAAETCLGCDSDGSLLRRLNGGRDDDLPAEAIYCLPLCLDTFSEP